MQSQQNDKSSKPPEKDPIFNINNPSKVEKSQKPSKSKTERSAKTASSAKNINNSAVSEDKDQGLFTSIRTASPPVKVNIILIHEQRTISLECEIDVRYNVLTTLTQIYCHGGSISDECFAVFTEF